MMAQHPSFSPAEFGTVGVLMGGVSAEREISLKSGRAVHQALLQLGIEAQAVDVGPNLVELLLRRRFDRVFIALHGGDGEGGQVQAVLEALNIPYTGSGVAASALALDKWRAKLVWQALGLPTPASRRVRRLEELKRAADEIGYPLAVKPVLEGSSLGVTRVDAAAGLEAAWAHAVPFGPVLAERWIEGRELTLAVLGSRVLPAIELRTSHRFYDYSAKYNAPDTECWNSTPCPG